MPLEQPSPVSPEYLRAVPDGASAICADTDECDAPAVIFNEAASPGALVSWAWSQLTALDTLLLHQWMNRASYDEQDVAEAVRAILGPVINALRLSEQRARELRKGPAAPCE
jgi:hypothetical protein